MQLLITHTTHYAYEPEAKQAALRLKLFPSRMAAQMSEDWQVTVNGKAVEPLLTEATGDQIALWHRHAPVDEIEIAARGTVTTADTAGVLKDLIETVRPAVFLRSTELTEPDDAIHELAAGVTGDDTLARLHALSAIVHEKIHYRPGATDAKTTAAEAVALGAGVCQDQTHVFLAAARSIDIPARYVVGYLFDPESKEESFDETHAWAEGHVPGLGWVGFDVTHQVCPTEAYVRLCCGLDAADAAPLRGTVVGEPEEELSTRVTVAEGVAQQQSQQ